MRVALISELYGINSIEAINSIKNLKHPMKYKFLCLLLLLLIVSKTNAQTQNDSFTQYSQIILLDTSVTPDYFDIEITIGEYRNYSGKGKRRTSTTITIDSISKVVEKELIELGIHTGIQLIHISELDGRHYASDAGLFQGTFKFQSNSTMLVDQIFKSFKAKFSKDFIGMIATPMISDEKLEKLKNELEIIAFEKAKVEAKKFAKHNDLSIIKNSVYSFNFNKKYTENNYSRNEYGQIKKFNISYKAPAYTVSFSCIFLMQ